MQCRKWTDDDDLVSRRMCILWTNFVKYGNPTPTGEDRDDEIGDLQWLPVSEASQGSRYLNIGTSLFMDESDEYVDTMAFWDDATQVL